MLVADRNIRAGHKRRMRRRRDAINDGPMPIGLVVTLLTTLGIICLFALHHATR